MRYCIDADLAQELRQTGLAGHSACGGGEHQPGDVGELACLVEYGKHRLCSFREGRGAVRCAPGIAPLDDRA